MEGLIDTSQVVAEHVPNDELHRVYSSAGIVLNDHWDDMREHGYISNRVYDALACGALVLSDEVPGLSERFGDAVAVYRSPRELRELIERLLADPAECRRRGELGRSVVLAEHTFAHRIDELLGFIEERVSLPGYPQRLRLSQDERSIGVERSARRRPRRRGLRSLREAQRRPHGRKRQAPGRQRSWDFSVNAFAQGLEGSSVNAVALENGLRATIAGGASMRHRTRSRAIPRSAACGRVRCSSCT